MNERANSQDALVGDGYGQYLIVRGACRCLSDGHKIVAGGAEASHYNGRDILVHKSNSTVMRVPSMHGLPIMTVGSTEMRELVIGA